MFARGLTRVTALLLAALAYGCAPTPKPGEPSLSVTMPIIPLISGQTARPVPQVYVPGSRNAAELRDEFGTPDFVRKETDSELWRYDGVNCALFVFLYRDKETYLLRHIETLPRGAQTATDDACLGSVKLRAASAG
ncbi:MAG: hypothetical protein ACXW3V_09550 [Methylocystis sp.]